jgi:hypothetical protein
MKFFVVCLVVINLGLCLGQVAPDFCFVNVNNHQYDLSALVKHAG